MNEENEEKIIAAENEADEVPHASEPTASRKPIYIAASIVGAIVLMALIVWIWRGRENGHPVPTPRTVSFDDNGNGQPSTANGDQTITIPADELDRAGIRVETVGETLSSEAANVSSTGVVQANAYGETPVISLLGGVVRRVDVKLGQNVQKGQTVAVVFSDDLAAAQSRYLALQTELATSRQAYDRAAKLAELNPVSRAELDDATAKLKTAEAELEEHRKHHEREMKLVEIGAASREELEQAITKMKTAEAEVEQLRLLHQRAIEVARLNPVSRGEFEQAAVKLRTAEVDRATAREKLLLYGLPAKRIDALRSPSQITSEIVLTAPVSGTITSRSVNPREVVEANKELLKVTNLTTVWVIAQLYEKNLSAMRPGSRASVTSDAYPGRLFRGHVAYIDPNLDQQTRTVAARVELENPGQVLKIGMYVDVAFGSMGNAESTAPIIPSSAVQKIDNRETVFVATDKPNVFTLRSVRLGTESNGKRLVLEGLNVGDKIVSDGSFSLRAEWLKQHP
ncbi:MAG: efflux RND transporter periplasmic adaptor subunit [Acidobacteriota bacterium]